jgi:hypothetical protein
MLRLLLAFATAPIAPLVIVAPVTFAYYGSFDAAGPFAFISIFYGYPAMLLLGMPLFLFHRKKHWLGWWQITIGGALVGAFVPVVLLSGLAFRDPAGLSLEVVASILGLGGLGAGLGALSGLSFWFVGIHRAPSHVEP